MFEKIWRFLNKPVIEVEEFKTVLDVMNEEGNVAALRALGYNEWADELVEAEKYLQKFVNDWNVKFEERPAEVRKSLRLANSIHSKAYKLLWNNRDKILER